MRRLAGGHPDNDELLRYADGELSVRASRRVRKHLAACWECRAELESLERTIGECVRYRKQVLKPGFPPPPQPWGDIYRRFDEADLAMAAASPLHRWMAALRSHPRRWATAAVALLLVLVVLDRFQRAPAVEAAELLRRAEAAAESEPALHKRIEIVTRGGRWVRTTPLSRAGAETEGASARLRERFVRAGYDWDDPLSARAFERWRARLPRKTDEVIRVEDPQSAGSCYRIRTATSSGDLAEVTLALSLRDLRPLESTMEFRDHEWVRIRALVPEPEAPPAPVAAAHATPPLRSSEPAPVSPRPRAESRATAADELRVMAALHELGADLGEPIEVSRSSDEVLVSGVGVAPERRSQIQAALDGVPNVSVRFSDVREPSSPIEPPPAGRLPAPPPVSAFEPRLERKAGGRVELEEFATQALETCDDVMSRVYALHRMAESFPAPVEAQLDAASRRLLRRIVFEHGSVLAQRAAELEKSLRPALVSLGAPASPAAAPALPRDWQSAAESLYQEARRVDRMTAAIFGSTAAQGPAEALPGELLTGLARLRSAAEAYLRLVGQ